jgi:hypothetical protein
VAQRTEPIDEERTSGLRRLRSVVLLIVLVVVLGALVASALGVIVIALASFIDQALE